MRMRWTVGTVLLFILVDMVTMVPITGEKIIIRDKKIYEKIENLICKYSQNFYQSKRSIKKCNSTKKNLMKLQDP